MNVPFLDLTRQSQELAPQLAAALQSTLESGRYVLAEKVEAFEAAFAATCAAAHCIGVGSGVDALELALLAGGVGPGDEVILPAATCVPTVAAIAATGAQPVLVDVDPVTATLDPDRLEEALTERSRAIVPVHLYGRCADMDPITAFARQHGLLIVEDAAQAAGATYRGRPAGALGDVAAFSFYPTKNLGAVGDGGAVVTSNHALAARVRLMRNHGLDAEGRAVVTAGHSRLDEVQAAILLEKLPHLDRWVGRRRLIAQRYQAAVEMSGIVTPAEHDPGHGLHLFVIRSGDRDGLREALAEAGIGTLVHYPYALHQHPAWRDKVRRAGSLAESERWADEVLSLPLYPELTDRETDAVIEGIRAAAKGLRSSTRARSNRP